VSKESPEASAHLESGDVGRLIGLDGHELLDGDVRRTEARSGKVGRLELGQCFLIELGFELLEHMREF